MNVDIKLVGGYLPKKSTNGAIGYDLYTPDDVVISERRTLIPMGFVIALPQNIEGKIETRSGCALRGICGYRVKRNIFGKQVISTQADLFDADVVVGKIDPDYRGEVGVILHKHDKRKFVIPKGTRIAQMTFYRTKHMTFTQVSAVDDTPRGIGGFGSTGK